MVMPLFSSICRRRGNAGIDGRGNLRGKPKRQLRFRDLTRIKMPTLIGITHTS